MPTNNARIPDINTIIQAGINPKTGLPLKLGLGNDEEIKNNINKILRVIDEQDFVNKYEWGGDFPDGLDGELLERILYYKNAGMLFWHPEINKFYFLPFTLEGNIDVYGRFTGIKPLPFNGSTADEKEKKKNPMFIFLDGINRKPLYDINDPNANKEGYCVILYDYCKQISQTALPRQILNEPILDLEAECIPFMRTNLIMGTGITGMRVNDSDQELQVELASKQVKDAALTGRPWIPIVGALEHQEIAGATLSKSEEYMLSMRALDNFRLQSLGLENGGLFEKKAHELESEAQSNDTAAALIYQDGLRLRQDFCKKVNKLFGLNLTCSKPKALKEEKNNDIKDTELSDNDLQ